MLYIVWLKGDGHPMAWFSVWPTKMQAIEEAQVRLADDPTAYPKGVRYVRIGSDLSATDLSYDGFLVVEQVTHYYHGA